MERKDVIELFGYWKSAGLKPPVSASSIEGQESMVRSFLDQYKDLNGEQVRYLRNALCRLQYWPRFYDVDDALAVAKENGILEETRCDLDDAGNLRIFYRITDFGTDMISRYLG